MNLLKERIKTLSNEELYLLHEDVVHRIGSHVAGGNTIEGYINKQQQILDFIQEEINRRMGGRRNE
jgi:hypothetical protein